MTHEPEHHVQSVIVGDLKLPPAGTAGAEAAEIDPDERVPMLIELNLRYPGGLATVRQDFYQLWASFVDRATGKLAGDHDGAVLIAADGIHSAPRAKLYPNEGPPGG